MGAPGSADYWRPWETQHCCPLCQTSFRRHGELKRHIDSHHNKILKKCEVCMKPFTRKDNLTRHMKCKHAKIMKPRCEFCSKPLSRKDSASRHQKTCRRNPARQPDSPPAPQDRPNVICRIVRGSVHSDSSDDSSSTSCSSH